MIFTSVVLAAVLILSVPRVSRALPSESLFALGFAGLALAVLLVTDRF